MLDDFDFKHELASYNCLEADQHSDTKQAFLLKGYSNHSPRETELVLLDLYSGCDGMPTGICLGAQVGGLCLVTASILKLLPTVTLLFSMHAFCFLFSLLLVLFCCFFTKMGC